MNSTASNRRQFLRRAAFAGAALSAQRSWAAPNLLADPAPGRKLNCVQIGCGGRGLSSHLNWLVRTSKDNVVAIVDADEKRHAEVKRLLQRQELDPDKLQVFNDYRVMFD